VNTLWLVLIAAVASPFLLYIAAVIVKIVRDRHDYN
jgi:hypothetical protein